MNIGALVPPALAPLIASLIITSGLGYPALFTTVGVDQLHGLLGAGAVDVGDHDARALAREQQRAGAADP